MSLRVSFAYGLKISNVMSVSQVPGETLYAATSGFSAAMNSVNLTTAILLVKYELKDGGAALTMLVRFTMVGAGGLDSLMRRKKPAVTRKVPLTFISKSFHQSVDEAFSIVSDGLVIDNAGSALPNKMT